MERRETEAQQNELPGPSWGRGQEYLLIWHELICTGHFPICTRSIRRFSVPLVNELFRNYSDALCHQILITRSAFLVGLCGAVQAASQAPESQASSKYMPWLFSIIVGRHQLGSHLISTSYRQRGISASISTSSWSLQECNRELKSLLQPLETLLGGGTRRWPFEVRGEGSAQAASFWEHQVSASRGCRQTRLPGLISRPSSSLSAKFQAGLPLWLTFKTVTSLQTLTWRPLSSLTLKCYHGESAQLGSAS